jgi:hypothetical protein
MRTLRLVQRATTIRGLHQVDIAIEGDGPQPAARAQVRLDLGVKELERLRWYLEDYLEYPVDPAPKIAAQVEQDMVELGNGLFRGVFEASEEGRRIWAASAVTLTTPGSRSSPMWRGRLRSHGNYRANLRRTRRWRCGRTPSSAATPTQPDATDFSRPRIAWTVVTPSHHAAELRDELLDRLARHGTWQAVEQLGRLREADPRGGLLDRHYRQAIWTACQGSNDGTAMTPRTSSAGFRQIRILVTVGSCPRSGGAARVVGVTASSKPAAEPPGSVGNALKSRTDSPHHVGTRTSPVTRPRPSSP